MHGESKLFSCVYSTILWYNVIWLHAEVATVPHHCRSLLPEHYRSYSHTLRIINFVADKWLAKRPTTPDQDGVTCVNVISLRSDSDCSKEATYLLTYLLTELTD